MAAVLVIVLVVVLGGGFFAARALGLLGGSQPAAQPSASPSPSSSPSSPAATPEASSSSEPSSAAPSSAQSSSPQAEPEPVKTPPARLVELYCQSGTLVAWGQTSKHVLSICADGGQLYYRGESKKSGNVIVLEAERTGKDAYTARNPEDASTTYQFSAKQLLVTSGKKVLVKDAVKDFTSYPQDSGEM